MPAPDSQEVRSASPAHHASGFLTPISLDRDTFMRRLITGLGHLNEAILGSDVAGGYIMNVGLSMGAAIEEEYKRFWNIDRPFTLDEYAHVIVDLKQKIKGNFSLVSKAPEKVVVRTTSCPFDALVRQSPSLCFMTSSVFGGIAARNFGYAKVVLHQRIALGDDGCYVTIHLQRTPEAETAFGKEYFPEVERASPDVVEQLRLMENVRRLRRELGEMHSRWEEIVRGAADAIVLLDFDCHIAYANGRWRDVLGIEGEELVGGVFRHLIAPEDQARFNAARGRVLDGLRITSLSLRLRHRDGSFRDTLASLGPVRDESGAIIGVLGIAHDVTEERESARLKDDFLNTASHELRTPVTTIRTITDVLLRTLERDGSIDPEQFVKRLQIIQRQTDRLTSLSSDLLDVSRVQRGKLALQLAPHDLYAIVTDCVKAQRQALPTGDAHLIRVTVQAEAADQPILAQVERPRIAQIIANLLENAVKYSPDGGEILVAIGTEGSHAYVRVTDHGIGIPEDDLPKIFTPFYRGSNASSRHFTGLGLGLYLSQRVAEAHGGQLSVASVEGEGSTFLLTLPLAARNDAAVAPAESERA
jgi:PAS domain S-box-containing protein